VFLLVPAYPGCPGQKQLNGCVCVCVVMCYSVLAASTVFKKQEIDLLQQMSIHWLVGKC